MKKKRLMITLLLVISILMCVGFAYAYLAAGVNNNNAQTASITTGTMNLTFADGTTVLNATQMTIGESVTKTFTIENTGTLEATSSMYFKDLKNTYMNGSMTYALYYSTTENDDYIILQQETNVPQSSTGTDQLINGNITVAAGQKLYYRLVITFNNLEDVDQTSDVNAVLNTSFTLKAGHTGATVSASPANYFITDGNGAIIALTEQGAQAENIVIPATINGEAITKIGNTGNKVYVEGEETGVFYNNKTLKTIDLGNVTEISSLAFDGCTSLKEVTGNKVDTIYDNAFGGCTSLMTVNMPNVSLIGAGVFGGCTILTTTNMPNLTKIGDYAFSNCTSLTTFDLANVTIVRIGTFSGCSSLKNIDLSKVTSILEEAFKGCSSLESVNLSSLKSISGWQEFYGCNNLTHIILNSNLKFYFGSEDHCTFTVSSSVSPLKTTIVNTNDEVKNYDWASVGRDVTFISE